MALPYWCDWDLEVSFHCQERMLDRDFTEVDLRAMLDDATDCLGQRHGTFVKETTHSGTRWRVIVRPDWDNKLIAVMTAYPVD